MTSKTCKILTEIVKCKETLTLSLISDQVDVYSLGVLLLEMCVHELPFVEKRHDQILKVSSDAIRRLIQQCVSHNPDERPSMKDVILRLSRINQRSMVKSEEQQPKEKMNDLQVKLKNTSIELEKTQVRYKTLEKHKQVKYASFCC